MRAPACLLCGGHCTGGPIFWHYCETCRKEYVIEMMDIKVLDVLISIRLLFSFALRFFPFRPVGASSPWLAGAFDGVPMSVASSPAPGVRRSRVFSAMEALWGPAHHAGLLWEFREAVPEAHWV